MIFILEGKMHSFSSQLHVLLAMVVLLVGLMPWQPVWSQVPFVPQ